MEAALSITKSLAKTHCRGQTSTIQGSGAAGAPWRREQPRLTNDGVDSDGELCAQNQGWPSPLPKVEENAV